MAEPTADHATLIAAAYWQWNDCEYGAPEIDPKRPYGNSDVEGDLAELLPHLPEEDRARVHRGRTTPTEVVNVLRHMAGDTTETETIPTHPLFETERWQSLFRCDSYYFAAKTHSDVSFDPVTATWFVTVTSNLKNYDDEIGKFIDWIAPHLNSREGEFLGYSLYEEDEFPTLYFMADSRIRATEGEKP